MEGERLSSLWSLVAGSQALCVTASPSGREIAVGTDTGCLVLDSNQGNRITSTAESSGRVSSIAFAGEGKLLVGGRGQVQLWDVATHSLLASLELRSDVEESDRAQEDVHIAPKAGGQAFGVASEFGRKVFVVNDELQIETELGVKANCGKISQLSWLTSSTLLATSHEGIQTWRCHGDNARPCLLLGMSIGLVTAKASPDEANIAAGSRDGVVYLWTLTEGDTSLGEDSVSAELRSTLKDYSHEIEVLCWDRHGKYLVSADGPEATIWEVPKLFKQTIQSTVCCGHQPGSDIQCAAFQGDGPILATGGSDGKVLFFNSDLFEPGQLNQPCAAVQNIPAEDGVACMSWLPGGRLVACTKTGKVVGWQLSQAAFEESHTSPCILHSVENSSSKDASTGKALNTGVLNGYTKKPNVQPATGQSNSSTKPVPQRGSSSGSLESGKPGKTGKSQLPSPPVHKEGAPLTTGERHMSMPNSRSGQSERSKLDAATSAEDQTQLGERAKSLQDNLQANKRGGSMERQQPALSPQLMQRIQQVQQKPAATSRQREPAGWGMGSPSSAPATQQGPLQMSGPGVMPYAPAPPQPQLPQGYMMYHNNAMGHQGMMPYGYPPTMTPVPMLTHPRTAQQGMVDSNAMQHGMVYMPISPHGMSPHHHGLPPQQQWPVMPWMGPYFMHPGQPPPEPVNLVAAGRSTSAPDGPASFNWASQPLQSSGPAQALNAQEELSKNAISLPHSLGKDWRASRAAASREEAHPIARTTSDSSMGLSKPRGSAPNLEAAPGGRKDAVEAKSTGKSLGDDKNGKRRETEGLGLPKRSSDFDLEGRPLDPTAPIVTVYVGNLAPTVDEQALAAAFHPFGHITNIQVIRDKNSLQSRGFAFVSYSQPHFAAAALQQMNGCLLYGHFKGRVLKVGPSNRVL